MLLNFFLILLTCVWVLLNNPCQAGLCWNKLGRVLLNLMAELIGHSKTIYKLTMFSLVCFKQNCFLFDRYPIGRMCNILTGTLKC